MSREQESDRQVAAATRSALVTGAAVVIPLIITAIIIQFILEFLYARIQPLTDVLLVLGFDSIAREVILEWAAPVVLVLLVLAVGVVVDRTRVGERAVDYLDYGISAVPGVGSIYDGFRQMSDVVMDSEVENFRDVKIVEFPQSETYTLGFVTTRTPDDIADPTPHDDMLTLFLPLAPNPVMGGHLVHVPRDRVLDVDMSVEEGMSAIVTTGVAAAETNSGDGLSEAELERLTGVNPNRSTNGDADDDAGARR